MVHIHGGGWMAGDKSQIHPLVVAECLKSGISVASINYRYTTTAPLPAPHLDSARAIQFLRSKARKWNLDPARVAAYGGSAGAGITLWLAFKPTWPIPATPDPMARQSTRLCCGATFGGQCTYDPHVIRRWIGEQAARHPVFNTAYHVKSYQDLDNPKLQTIYDEVSAIKHLTADAPPIFEVYSEANVPLTPDAQIGQGMHHPIFGLKLKDAMDRLGDRMRLLAHRGVLRRSQPGNAEVLPQTSGHAVVDEEPVTSSSRHWFRREPASGVRRNCPTSDRR